MRYLSLLLLLAFVNSSFSQAYLKSHLEYYLNHNNQELVPVIIKLKQQVDIKTLKSDLLKQNIDLSERQRIIVSKLKKENVSVSGFDMLIQNLKAEQPSEIKDIKRFWAVNAISCSISPLLIDAIIQSSEVDYVQFDFHVQGEKVIESKGPINRNINAIGMAEPGLIAINTRPMWALSPTMTRSVSPLFSSSSPRRTP